MSGSGISWAICKSAPRCRQITTPAPQHSVFTGRMPFLPRQSTEGTSNMKKINAARGRSVCNSQSRRRNSMQCLIVRDITITGLVGHDCLVNTDDCKKRRKKHLLYFISVHPHIYNKIKSNECREKKTFIFTFILFQRVQTIEIK